MINRQLEEIERREGVGEYIYLVGDENISSSGLNDEASIHRSGDTNIRPTIILPR